MFRTGSIGGGRVNSNPAHWESPNERCAAAELRQGSNLGEGLGGSSDAGSAVNYPRMNIFGGGRDELTITGASVFDRGVGVGVDKVWHQDTPYKSIDAWTSLEKVACKEILGEGSEFLKTDSTNHARRLKEYAVALFAAKHENGVSDEFKKAFDMLNKALNDYKKNGEHGYSSTHNVGKASAYNCDRQIKSAIDNVVAKYPGVFNTAAKLMHDLYLREGLVRAQAERQGLRFDAQTMERISRAGNGDSSAHSGLVELLNGRVLEGNGSGLSGFMRTMLAQLDFGRDPKSVNQKDHSLPGASDHSDGRAHPGGGLSSTSMGGASSISGISFNNENHAPTGTEAIFSAVAQVLRDVNETIRHLRDELAAVRNLKPVSAPVPQSPSSNSSVSVGKAGVDNQDNFPLPPAGFDVQEGPGSLLSNRESVVDFRRIQSSEPKKKSEAPTDAPDSGSPSYHESVAGLEDAPKQPNKGGEIPVPPKMPEALAVFPAAGLGKGGAFIGAEDMLKQPNKEGEIPVPPKMPEALAVFQAAGLGKGDAVIEAEGAPKLPNNSRKVNVSPPKPDKPWGRDSLDVSINSMPRRFSGGDGLYRARGPEDLKRFLGEITHGISPIGEKAKALRAYITQGHDPSKAKEDISAEGLYVRQIWEDLKIQSPAVAERVELLFSQYTKALGPMRGPLTPHKRIVSSVGGSTGVSGNPTPEPQGY